MLKKEKNHQIEKFMRDDVPSMDFYKAGNELVGVYKRGNHPTH